MPICFRNEPTGHNQFRSSDPNCLDIGLVNNMPDSALEATERQYLGLLVEAAGDNFMVRFTLYALPDVPRGEWGRRHVRSYAAIGDSFDSPLDGLIVTGAEPRAANIMDEPFWGSLTRVMDWAEENTYSAVWSCLAAQAVVLHIDKIRRRPLGAKRCGIFDCERTEDHQLTGGAVAARSRMPHSRWNEIPEEALRSCGYRVLTQSRDAGVDTFVKARKSFFVCFQGHPEYGSDTLLLEYRRDVKRFLDRTSDAYPAMPQYYFDQDTTAALNAFRQQALSDRREELIAGFPTVQPAGLVANTWHSDAVRLYRNWFSFMAEKKDRKLRARSLRQERAQVAAR
jgi:homoserine O-succinyltransferase